VEDFDGQLGRALLEVAVRVRGDRDPIGVLSRAVLAGELGLRDAAESARFRDALGAAFVAGSAEVDRRTDGDVTVKALMARRLEGTEPRS
jgi:hypothetical protein